MDPFKRVGITIVKVATSVHNHNKKNPTEKAGRWTLIVAEWCKKMHAPHQMPKHEQGENMAHMTIAQSAKQVSAIMWSRVNPIIKMAIMKRKLNGT